MPHENKTHLLHYEVNGRSGYAKAWCGAYLKIEDTVPRYSPEVTCKNCQNAWDKTRKFFR